MNRIIFKDFRIIDESIDVFGSIIIENGIIKEIISGNETIPAGSITVNGQEFSPSAVLMPAFIDLHAHFRDTVPQNNSLPDVPFPAETIESASLAAAAGGYTTLVCMANTVPVIDTAEKAAAIKARSDSLGLINLYPVLSLTKNMEGKMLSGITDLISLHGTGGLRLPLMISEDGKDIASEQLFLAAMQEAKRLDIPVSCHCDFAGQEHIAVLRAIETGKKAGCRIHIAHVSAKETIEIIRSAKQKLPSNNGFSLSCEATPHHIGATEEDAQRMGEHKFGRVNPPLRTKADRMALAEAARCGIIDAIATDHAPHKKSDKAAGAPGFTGLETAFAASLTYIADNAGSMGLNRLSALMSGNPARILRLHDRGRISADLRADIVIVDTNERWTVNPEKFKSRGICSPFLGRELRGKVLMTVNAGRIIFSGDSDVYH